MTINWLRPPQGWKWQRWQWPSSRRRTRRIFSSLLLAWLVAINSLQPALAAAAPRQAARGPDNFSTSGYTGFEAPYAANLFQPNAADTITNTVTVDSTTTDPNAVNNTAVQTTTVTSQADLQISKTDGVSSVLPGTVVTYTIVVTNAGPSAVTGATVADTFPAAITSASWSCVATGGSSCSAASGTGNLNTTVNLAVNGTATFKVVANVASTAVGTLVNTATVTPPVGTTDPVPGNNSATDTDNLLTGTLTGTVYLDANGNGSYDSGEGLNNVTVAITTSVGTIVNLTTDANGAYTATVPAGNTGINVDETDLPTGAVQIQGTDPTTVTVPAGSSASDIDGYEQQGQVVGHIFEDVNGDGNQDSGEPNLPNVAVVITDGFGVTQTVTTDANGNYTATVPIGSTTTNVVEATLPAGSVQTAGVDPTTVTVTPANTVSAGNDGYQRQGLVDGTVYMDENGDGAYTVGTDTPLPDVTVMITDSNGVTYTLITASDGYFSQIVPAGDTDVDIDNSDGDLPANVVLTGGSSDPTTVNVPGGGTATDNTGYVLLASIGDRVWLDLDGDGNQDANEPGLAGVEVELTLPGGATQMATTGPDGYYTFSDLRPGVYTITVMVATLPAGVTQTYDPDSTLDHQDTVTLLSNGLYQAGDFGYQGNSSIGDLVWLDSDGDGNRDLGEVGIPNVVVTLTMASGWEITATTNGTGAYDFGGLIAGTYTVTVAVNTLPSGAVLTTANQPLNVNLSTGQDYNLADFGYQRQAQVIGHLFEDTDGNGVQNGAEPNLPNITVIITDSLGLTQTLITDANGNYTATVPVDSTTAPTDTITVDVDETTLPAGAVQTAGTDPDSVEVTAATTTNAGADGYQIQGVVEGVVYTDVNQNGTYDSGTDLPLVSVSVLITDSNGVLYTVSTDSNGYFSQTVPAGNTGVNVADGDVAGLNADLMIEQGFTDPDSVVVPGGGVGSTNFPYVEPLTIDKDVVTSAVVAGTQVTYTIVLRNIGGNPLTSVTVSDTLPVSFTYATYTVNAVGATRTATVDPTTGDSTPTWGSWTINSGGSLTIVFVANVDSAVSAGSYDNTASANSDQTSLVNDNGTSAQDDNTPLGSDPESDEDVTISTVADLAITKLDDPDPVVAGTTLTYTIEVINYGPSDAQNVIVTDQLPADLLFVSASPGCALVSGDIVCNLGTLAVGATVTITVVTTVANDLLAFGGSSPVYALATPAADEVALAAEPVALTKEVSQAGAVEALAAASATPGQVAGQWLNGTSTATITGSPPTALNVGESPGLEVVALAFANHAQSASVVPLAAVSNGQLGRASPPWAKAQG